MASTFLGYGISCKFEFVNNYLIVNYSFLNFWMLFFRLYFVIQCPWNKYIHNTHKHTFHVQQNTTQHNQTHNTTQQNTPTCNTHTITHLAPTVYGRTRTWTKHWDTQNHKIKITHTQLIGNQNQQTANIMNNLKTFKNPTSASARALHNTAFDLIALICWH